MFSSTASSRVEQLRGQLTAKQAEAARLSHEYTQVALRASPARPRPTTELVEPRISHHARSPRSLAMDADCDADGTVRVLVSRALRRKSPQISRELILFHEAFLLVLSP